MSDLQNLLIQKEAVLAKIKEIEICEGIDNEQNAERVQILSNKQIQLMADKKNLQTKIGELERAITTITQEVSKLSVSGVGKILEAIKEQRWYFFKNKPKVLFDRDTGLLWANLDYFPYRKNNNSSTYTTTEAAAVVAAYNFDDIAGFRLPNCMELESVAADKKFPFAAGKAWQIKECKWWFVNDNDNVMIKYLDRGVTGIGIIASDNASLIPCSDYLIAYSEYANNVSAQNLLYTEAERLQFTLDLFVSNDLWPVFYDEEITQLYNDIYFEKPSLQVILEDLQEEIDDMQELTLLSSDFDYTPILSKYNDPTIELSVIKYARALKQVANEFMDKLMHYEEIKADVIQDFAVIGLRFIKKYDVQPQLSIEENDLLAGRQAFFQKNFTLSIDNVQNQLVSVIRQADDLEQRLAEINSRSNSIASLSELQAEKRPSLLLVIENIANTIKNTLLKIEFFEAEKALVKSVVTALYSWHDDYVLFKSVKSQELNSICQEDEIESEVYTAWYIDWQKKRFAVEKLLLPLVEFALMGKLLEKDVNGLSIIEKTIAILEQYKKSIDDFYLHERKTIYQKFAFQAGGDLQEKFEAEGELYKLVSALQSELTTLIFSINNTEERLFLLKWADRLLDIQIDEIVKFVQDNNLSKISEELLREFVGLKQQNFETFLSDSKIYAEALKEREKEYNSLVFKMRKELMKK